jgi:23S rRNA maturation-related 3'-5' exoribonuclease YhaM
MLNEEERAKKAEQFKVFYEVHIKRPGAEQLMDWLEEEGFFEAPASTKYHGNYAGGLVEHSLNVYLRLIWIERNERNRTYDDETIAICGLLHDVCKADSYMLRDGEYKYTNHFPIGHGEKSVIQIQKYMRLTNEEMMAIRWHMGGWDNAVRGGSYDFNNASKASKLVSMLHIADMAATYLDERG